MMTEVVFVTIQVIVPR